MLKVGFTSFKNGRGKALCRTKYIIAGRQNGRRMFGPEGDIAESIWLRPGDMRYESYIQACMAFRYSQPTWPEGKQGGRMYEWVYVGAIERDALIKELDALYEEAKGRESA